jgi:phosphonate transport system substrate-binding protein
MTDPLRFTSIQSPSADGVCAAIARYVSSRLEIPTQFVGDLPWPERERLLDEGQIQVGWICGLPYVWKADRHPPLVRLLAAPVMQHPRYEGRPIYFSDVIVHRDSGYRTFSDLRGASWAYNEPHSQSGYNVTRYHLATLGETSGYFSRVVEAGSHLRALKMVLDRRIDASAIDSTVLELELQRDPGLADRIRIVETLGPSPIPPWVVAHNVSPEMEVALRQVFLGMHQHAGGRQVLEAGQMDRFLKVEDRDYDPIRQMARQAQRVRW